MSQKYSVDFPAWSRLLTTENLPAVLIDLEAFDRNVDALVEEVAKFKGFRKDPPAIRIASKSIRVPWLLKRALDRHPKALQGLMCYSARECAFLARNGFDDLLLAYPSCRTQELSELCKIFLETNKKISVVVDSDAGLRALSENLPDSAQRKFPVLLEFDVSLRPLGSKLVFGVRRSPLRNSADLKNMIESIQKKYPKLRFAGIMVYEAQVAGLGDQNPFAGFWRNLAAKLIRTLSRRFVAKKRRALQITLDQMGLTAEIYNGAGTGSLRYAAREECLTEVTAGSGLMTPHLFDYYSNLETKPALFFACEVVRQPDPGWFTCAGGGYIASGAAGRDRLPTIVWPENAELTPLEGCGEVQTPFIVPESNRPRLGELAYFRPAKAGEIAERFNQYLVIENYRIVYRAPTYRGLGECFL